MRYFLFILIMILSSCSIYKTRSAFTTEKLSIKGGVYEDETWDTSLYFKRYSWYIDATLKNEILIADLDNQSEFFKWLGNDTVKAQSCKKFQIALVYSDANAEQSNPYLIDQIRKSQVEVLEVLDFKKELKSHQNLKDWYLSRHKIVGLCSDSGSFTVSIPSFMTKTLQ